MAIHILKGGRTVLILSDTNRVGNFFPAPKMRQCTRRNRASELFVNACVAILREFCKIASASCSRVAASRVQNGFAKFCTVWCCSVCPVPVKNELIAGELDIVYFSPLSVDSRPTRRPIIGRLSVDCRSAVGRLSVDQLVDCRPTVAQWAFAKIL